MQKQQDRSLRKLDYYKDESNLQLGRTRRSAQIAKEDDDDFQLAKSEEIKEKMKADREARLQRRKENKEYGQIGHKRNKPHKHHQTRKRRRIDDSEDQSEECSDMEDGESELSEAEQDNGIELSGKLNLVYEEHGHFANRIDKVKMVLKGLWKLAWSEEDDSQNLFLYQKIGIPIEEELIEEYFCDDVQERLQLSAEHYQQQNKVMQAMSIELDLKNLASIERCLIDSQGLYTGFFVYEGRKVNEKFSIIQKKLSWKERQEMYGDERGRSGPQKQAVKLCGYGMNDEMGPFLIEGFIEIFGQHKLKEKVMAT